MGRHNGSQKRAKRKGFKRSQQLFDQDGGAITINGRKFFSHQMNEAGHAFEDLVGESLRYLQSQGKILRYIRHAINSSEDKAGKDFTIWIGDQTDETKISFGISISKRRVQSARLKHPQVPQLLMRHEWTLRYIAHNILQSFELSKAA